MKSTNPILLLSLSLMLLVFQQSSWAIDSEQKSSTQLKSKIFKLKTHEDAFGKPRIGGWNKRRTYTAEIAMSNPGMDDPSVISKTRDKVVLINGKRDWEAKYFVSKSAYVVRDVKMNRNTAEVKLQAADRNGGTELKLTFIGLDLFEALFDGIFFRAGDDMEAYEDEVNGRLIVTYINSKFDFSKMSEQEKRQLLKSLQSLTSGGYPEIEAHKEEAYALVRLSCRPVSNRFHNDKDKRILTSAEAAMKDAKLLIQSAQAKSPFIQGYEFYWQHFYQAPYEEEFEVREELSLMTKLSVFAEYEKGKLSVLETIEKSVLKVDGKRYLLTPYEPEN